MYRIIGADQQEYGPVTAGQIRQWVAEGRADAETRIKAEGTDEWKPLSSFPEFVGAFSPPGLPPSAPGAPLPSGEVPVQAPGVQRMNPLALGGFICGIIGILPPCCLLVLPQVLALVFSILGIRQIDADPAQFRGRGLAIAGIVLGAVGLLIAVLAWPTMDWSRLDEWIRQLEEAG